MTMKLVVLISLLVLSLLARLSQAFDVINRNVTQKPLRVEFGRSAYITWDHLPIMRQLTKIGLCRVEVIDIEPLSSAVGYLEPKIFPCSFKNFTIKYVHEGSRLTKSDKVHLRIFFFRTYVSATNRTHINIELIEAVKPSRVEVRSHLFVQNWKGSSQAISPQLMHIQFSRDTEYCEVEHTNVWNTNMAKHPWLITRSWPLTGLLVTFNKTKVYAFRHECQHALLMGYRFINRQTESVPLDFIPLTIRIMSLSNRLTILHEERILLPVHLNTKQRHIHYFNRPLPIPPPIKVKNFRSIKLKNQGGTLSGLPSDILEIGVRDKARQPLIISMEKLEGAVKARLINSRNPSENVYSFSYSDLLKGHVSFCLNQYSNSNQTQFRMDLVVMDTFFVRSERIIIKLVTHYRNQFSIPPFKVFTRPFLVYTSQRRGIRPYNIQIIGAAKNEVKYRFLDNPDRNGNFYKGATRLSVNQYFTPYDIENDRVTYRHKGTLLKSFPLQLEVLVRGSAKIQIVMPVRVIRLYENSNVNITGLYSKYELKKSNRINVNHKNFVKKDYLYFMMKDKMDMKFKILRNVLTGSIVKQIPGYSKAFKYKLNDVINLRDIIAGLVYYKIEKKANNDSHVEDMLYLQQINHHKNFQTQLHFISEKRTVSYLIKSSQKNRLRCKETSPYCVVSEKYLNFKNYFVKKSQIQYVITHSPNLQSNGTVDAGRIISLQSLQQEALKGDTFLQTSVENYRRAQITSVASFTHHQVASKDIVYIPPNIDVGESDKYVSLTFNVKDVEGNEIEANVLHITLEAVNNQFPVLVKSNLTLPRDGILEINHRNLVIRDIDTKYDDLQIKVHTLPKFGTLKVREKEIKGTKMKLSASLLKSNKLEYFHNGRNVQRDSFNISIFDGVHSTPELEVPIRITKRVLDSSMRLFYTNNTLIVQEGSMLTLQNAIFKKLLTSKVWSATQNPRFIIIGKPTLGNICVRRSDKVKDCQVSDFDYKTVKKSKVYYQHNGNEVGSKPKYDFAQIWVIQSDDQFYINFTISPVNNKPPELVNQMVFRLNEGSDAPIHMYILAVRDPDSDESDVSIIVVSSPKWGIIANKNSPTVALKEFKAGQIMRKEILYRHTRSGEGNEHSNDVFSVKAFDGKLYSQIQEVMVIIHPQNDEKPVVALHDFNVALKQKKTLDSRMLVISDADIPSNILYFSLHKPLRYGDLVLQHQFSEVVTTATSPISTQVLAVARLMYVQKQSSIVGNSYPYTDLLVLRINDGLHSTTGQCNITITGPNKGRPVISVSTIHLNSVSILNISSTHISVLDNDTLPMDLTIILVTVPKRGFLSRDGTKLTRGSMFSQRDINENLITFSYTGIEKPVLRDRFSIKANDGFFMSGITLVTLALRNPIPVNKMLIHFQPFVFHIDQYYPLTRRILDIKNPNIQQLTNLTISVPEKLTCGYFYKNSSISRSISVFSYSQLMARKVGFYIPTCPQAVPQLTIPFTVNSIHNYKYTSIMKVSVLPRKNRRPRLYTPSASVRVVAEADTIIDMRILNCSDSDNIDSEIVYTLNSNNAKLKILLEDNKPTLSFTQADITANRVILRLLKTTPSNNNGNLELTLTDGVSKGIIWNGKLVRNGKFSIALNLINWNMQKMNLLRFSGSSTMKQINGKAAFLYSSKNLLVTNRRTVIKVISPLKHGFFFNSHTNRTVTKFRQIDVNRRRIYYMLNKNMGLETNSEAVKLNLVSDRSNQSKILFQKWNTIGFKKNELKFCAHTSVMYIPLIQKYHEHVANLSVYIRLESTKLIENKHYRLLSKKRLHFSTKDRPVVQINLLSFSSSKSHLIIDILSPRNVLLGSFYSLNVLFENSTNCKSPGSNYESTYNLMNMMQQDSPSRDDEYKDDNSPEPDSMCPDGWQFFKSRCYKAFDKLRRTWESARKLCRDQSGYIANTDDAKTFKWLQTLFGKPRNFWIGLRRLNSVWIYDNNESPLYEAWDKGFPFDKCKSEYNKRCNHPKDCVLVNKRGIWHNRKCGRKKSFVVCMRNPLVY